MAAALPPGPCMAALRCRCDAYGLSTPAIMASVLDVAPRSIERWWRTDHVIPPGVLEDLEELFVFTEHVLAAAIVAHQEADVILTYRETQRMHDLCADYAERELPASWHRILVNRVRLVLPHLDVQYA